MYSPSANFLIYNALLQRKPVVVVQFAGIATYFCNGLFSGITSAYKKFLRAVKITPAAVDPVKFQTEASSVEFEIHDDSSGTVLALWAANNMLAKQVTVKLGFQQLAISDFLTLETQYVDDFEYRPHKIWKVNTKGKLVFELVTNIFLKYGYASHVGNCAASDDHIHVYDHEGRRFTTAATPPWGEGTQTYLQIGPSQLVDYDSIVESAEVVDGITTDIINSVATIGSAHGHNEPVREVFKVFSHGVFTFLMNILTTTNAGTNGDWDCGADYWGMGISISLIDFNQIRNEISGATSKWGDTGNDWHCYWVIYPSEFCEVSGSGGGSSYRFSGGGTPMGYGPAAMPEYSMKLQSVNGLDWIEKNILPLLPAHFITTKNGKIGIRVWDVGASGDYDAEITEDDIISIEKMPMMDKEATLTHIGITSKKIANDGNGITFSSEKYQCDAADTAYGEQRCGQVEYWPWGPGGLEPIQFYMNRMMERYFGKYGNPPVEIKMKVHHKHHLLLPGDRVAVTHSKFPKVSTGTYGWSKVVCEVLKVDADYGEDDLVNLTLVNHNDVEFADNQDVHIWSETDLDTQVGAGEARKILLEDATNAAGLDANDSFLDQSTYSATHVMVEFELTLPAAGGGVDDAYITVTIHVQDPEGTDLKTQTKRIYYDETATGTQKTALYVLNLSDDAGYPLTATNVKRVKCDWTAHSGANAPSAVEMTQVKYWNFKATISSETIR